MHVLHDAWEVGMQWEHLEVCLFALQYDGFVSITVSFATQGGQVSMDKAYPHSFIAVHKSLEMRFCCANTASLLYMNL